MSFYLSKFQSIRPRYELNQSEGLARLIELRLKLRPFPESWDEETIQKRVKRFGLASAQITKRGTELLDYMPGNHPDSLFGAGKIPDLTERMEFFKTRAEEVMRQFYQEDLKKPDHLIHVSCTGYLSPSAAQDVAADWAQNEKQTTVTHAYHM